MSAALVAKTMETSECQNQSLLPRLDSSVQPRSIWREHYHDFPVTMQMLVSGHSRLFWKYISWIFAFFLIFFLPLLRLLYVKASYDNEKHQLVFQPLIVVAGSLISFVSFLFFIQTIHKFRRKVPNLDVNEAMAEMKIEYEMIMQGGCRLLAILFCPLIILFAIHKCWLYAVIDLKPLPFGLNKVADLILIGAVQSTSWLFQTFMYLYACILFWKVCTLQLLHMKNFKDILPEGFDPENYYTRYKLILSFLSSTSYHFRSFLAMTGCITVSCVLASLYEIVNHLRTGTGILMTADLMVLNVVNITGWGLCLRSASKVAHMHRKIVRIASSMHADATFADLNCFSLFAQGKGNEISERIGLWGQCKASWLKRAALVNFLVNNNAGISVYGFILDRFFVHTSLGALATTTWFVLGQSLSH